MDVQPREKSKIALMCRVGSGPDGRLRLDVPVELPAGAVELVMVVGSTTQPNRSKYNFADVVEKLKWQGDALEEQRKLHDEW